MRTAEGETELRDFLHKVGNGLNFEKIVVQGEEIDSDVIKIPAGMSVSKPDELIDFVFPSDALANPLESKQIVSLGLDSV